MPTIIKNRKTTMRHNSKTAAFIDNVFPIVTGVIFCLIACTFVSIPVAGYFQAKSLQKSLNAECGTDYTLIDVAFNGDNLLELCRVKQQQITIK